MQSARHAAGCVVEGLVTAADGPVDLHPLWL